jgi:hypothetical protein
MGGGLDLRILDRVPSKSSRQVRSGHILALVGLFRLPYRRTSIFLRMCFGMYRRCSGLGKRGHRRSQSDRDVML